MQPRAGACCVERVHLLYGEAGDQSGQYVARSGGGQERRTGRVHHGATVRRGDHSVGPFQQDHTARPFSRRANAGDPCERAIGQIGKQPPELAEMRREHGVRPERRKQHFPIGCEHTQRVGVQHQPPARPRKRQHRLPRARRDAGAGSQDNRACVFGRSARRRDVLHLTQHDRGQVRGVLAHRQRGREHGHQPRADTQRGPRRQPRGAGVARPAADDHRVPARVFVTLRAWPGQCPEALAVFPQSHAALD